VTVSFTVYFNHLYNLLFALLIAISVLPPDIVNVLPPKWKPYVGTASAAALWIKSHLNLYVNPDGTPARSNWNPPPPKPPSAMIAL
jgi:hypothetical protein